MTATQETNRATPLPTKRSCPHQYSGHSRQRKMGAKEIQPAGLLHRRRRRPPCRDRLLVGDPRLPQRSGSKTWRNEMQKGWPVTVAALHNQVPGLYLQDVSGRIPHQASLSEETPDNDTVHRDVTLMRRAIETMGIDMQIVFPQPMLEIGLHPSRRDRDAADLCLQPLVHQPHPGARDRGSSRCSALPFGNPEACLRTIDEFAGKPRRGRLPDHRPAAGRRPPRRSTCRYTRALEERGLPLGFHAGPDYSIGRLLNRFVSVHSLSFVTCNMIHLTNWIMNGLNERFPNLKVIWIESGLAWLPFMMQRLDHEYLMRQSDAPLLKKLPSEYMRDMYYTSQPMERTNLKLLESDIRRRSTPRRSCCSRRTGRTGTSICREGSSSCRGSPTRAGATSSGRQRVRSLISARMVNQFSRGTPQGVIDELTSSELPVMACLARRASSKSAPCWARC